MDDGFKVVAFARKGRGSPIRHSRHVACYEICAPESDLQESLSDLRLLLASLGAKANQQLLLPLDDKALYLCGRVQIEGCWVLAGPKGGSADLALNKYLQTEAARSAGFNVPKTQLVRTADEVLASNFDAWYPIILRPVDCVPMVQGRIYKSRNWICADSDELKSAVSQWAGRVPLLIQPFITGTGEGVLVWRHLTESGLGVLIAD